MLRIVVRCSESPVLSILTDVKVDERFLEQVADTFVSAPCPLCMTAHTTRLKYCGIYKLRGISNGKQAA